MANLTQAQAQLLTIALGVPLGGWTQHNCTTLFGHRDCLIARRSQMEVK